MEARMTTRNFTACGVLLAGFALVGAQAAPQLGQILDRLGKGAGGASGDGKIVAGLKEALQIGTANAVLLTGKPDGFFGNPAIKILLPEKLRTLEKGLRIAGMGGKVDEFELSMNRAAEKAAPAAKTIFLNAIRDITLEDGRKILTGGNTAATDYFRSKTAATLAIAFRPIVQKAMDETGVGAQYKQLTGSLPQLPFVKKDAFDIDEYVVSRSLDGLFHMVGEEERKIRTDPAARVTSLLKDVFAR